MAVNSVCQGFLFKNIGIKPDFLCIDISRAPKEMKSEPERRGFQPLPRGPVDVNVSKSMLVIIA